MYTRLATKNRIVRQNWIRFTPISIEVHWAKRKDKPFETLRKEPAAPTSKETEWVDLAFYFYYCLICPVHFTVLYLLYYCFHNILPIKKNISYTGIGRSKRGVGIILDIWHTCYVWSLTTVRNTTLNVLLWKSLWLQCTRLANGA
jgi:hypothetical protein